MSGDTLPQFSAPKSLVSVVHGEVVSFDLEFCPAREASGDLDQFEIELKNIRVERQNEPS